MIEKKHSVFFLIPREEPFSPNQRPNVGKLLFFPSLFFLKDYLTKKYTSDMIPKMGAIFLLKPKK